MKTKKFTLALLVSALCVATVAPALNTSAQEKESAISVAERVGNYYLANYADSFGSDVSSTLFGMGLYELSQVTGNKSYLKSMKDLYGSVRVSGELSDADQISSIQLYYSIAYADNLGADPSAFRSDLEFLSYGGLYSYNRVENIYSLGWTGEYLTQKTGQTFFAQTDYASYSFARKSLFDFEEGFWYRDKRFVSGGENSLSQTTEGGKVLWSRGNALVYLSLADRLRYAEEGSESYNTYLYDFLLMSQAVKEAQREDGFWNVNLNSSLSVGEKETTGTAGFLYGLSVGLSLGILDGAEYLSVAKEAYEALLTIVDGDGRVGYCQANAVSPDGYTQEEFANNTNLYGAGMFLLGATAYSVLEEVV